VGKSVLCPTGALAFGDFEFEKLEKYLDYVIKVKTETDICLGLIRMKKV
jgi:hypothetical protein